MADEAVKLVNSASVTWAAHVNDASGRNVTVVQDGQDLTVYAGDIVVCKLLNSSRIDYQINPKRD